MTTPPGSGPLWTIDGPPPQAPTYTLLGAARVVPDADAGGVERWGNGVKVYSYPPDIGHVQDACVAGSTRVKQHGGVIPLPEFGAMTVYLAETCSSFGIFGENLSNDEAQARFVARATSALGAVESAAVEREFMAGDVLGLNHYLADGNGTFPAGNTATSVVESFALLEDEIAKSGRKGMIHCSPSMATKAHSQRVVHEDDRLNVLCTINGTTVVPGYGYEDNAVHPIGKAAPSAHQGWIYATGPVDVRRTDYEVLPGDLWMALDRAQNEVTYRVERYYLVDWDTAIQAAVLADRTLS
jgi:hypothetical protein